PLPWKDDELRPDPNYGTVRNIMVRQLARIEQRGLKPLHDQTMSALVTEQHTEIVRLYPCQDGYFMTYRLVHKEESTTQSRPVFNGSFSANDSNGNKKKSLNDCLYKGAWPQTKLLHILLKWRLNFHPVFA